MRELELFFDFLSPYSYLAWCQLRSRPEFAAERVRLRVTPVLFAGLLGANGRVGPAEVPAQRSFVIRDCLRAARRLGVPFTFPATHPFRPLTALRLAQAEVSGERQHEAIDAIWSAGWAEGRDLGCDQTLASALEERGLPGAEWLAKTREPAAKAALRASTERALAQGAFGVPTLVVEGELFWGSDRLDDVARCLSGEGALDPELIARIEAVPAAASRGPKAPPAPEAAPALITSGLDEAVIERVKRIFHSAPFVQHLGVELLELGEGRAVTRLRVRPEHLQQDGFVHAGVTASLADHSAGVAAGTCLPAGRTPLSIEFKVNLLRPAVGEVLTCTSTVLRQGRTVGVAESGVSVGDKLVAKASVTLAAAEVSGLRGKSEEG